MNYADILRAVLSLHNPHNCNDPMVYQVWEDGEITLTKGGDIFGQRNLHMQQYGHPHISLEFHALPYKTEKHSSILCASYDDAIMARNLIFSLEL